MKHIMIFEKFNTKSMRELIDYMWKVYPREDQLAEREAMVKAYDFITGKTDKEEKEKMSILKDIQNKHK